MRRVPVIAERLEERLALSVFTVTTADDAGPGSLRQAIVDANASPSDDTITFDSAGVFATPQTILLQTMLPQIAFSGGLAITGTGANRLTVRRNSAAPAFPILYSSAFWLSLSGFTISGGSSTASGGGVFSSRTLLIDQMVFSDNHAGGNGGAIAANSTLNVRNSTLINNTANATGGAIYAFSSITVQNSTIASNTASAGGGIAASNNLKVENSTMTRNTANGSGSLKAGGGIYQSAGMVSWITNSIVSGNVNATAPDISAAQSGAAAIVKFSAIGSTAGFVLGLPSGNLPIGANLRLDSLRDNGGPTPTIAPLPGSPLIDAGSSAATASYLIRDQRGMGFIRSYGSNVDIGAVEVQPPGTPDALATTSNVTTAGDTLYTFAVTFVESFGDNRGIDTTTIIGNNNAIRITGPNGFDSTASYVSIDDPTNGAPRTAIFGFAPPGGTWDGPDTGDYTISMLANQTRDIDGNPVPPVLLGSFKVDLPRTLLVTNINDTGPGSLLDAIQKANTSASADSISFDPTVFSTPQTISLHLFASAAGGPLTITGPGPALLKVWGSYSNSVIAAFSPILNLSGMTLGGGNSHEYGGGIEMAGLNCSLTLDNVVITQSESSKSGGAIAFLYAGSLVIRNSVISHNSATWGGGGIYMAAGGSLIIENSTIDSNWDRDSGAILFSDPSTSASGSTILIRNSTISNNMAFNTFSSKGPSAIALPYFNGLLKIQNSTISGNRSDFQAIWLMDGSGSILVENSTITANLGESYTGSGGGGIVRGSAIAGSVTIRNSIVSGNTAHGASDILASDATTTNINFSAIGSPAGFTLSPTSGDNLPFGTDLMLGPLIDSGNVNPTQVPRLGSPLIDAGSDALIPADITFDQRGDGFPRIVGPAVDIGAAEYSPLPAVIYAAFEFQTIQRIHFIYSDTAQVNSQSLFLPWYSIEPPYWTFYRSGPEVIWTPNFILPDADFTATVGSYTLRFSFLLGDLNRDRAVSVSDFIDLAANFGKQNATYSDGDVNYDGIVSISDFIDVASRFNQSLPPPPAIIAPLSTSVSVDASSLRSLSHHRRHPKRHHPRPALLFRHRD